MPREYLLSLRHCATFHSTIPVFERITHHQTLRGKRHAIALALGTAHKLNTKRIFCCAYFFPGCLIRHSKAGRGLAQRPAFLNLVQQHHAAIAKNHGVFFLKPQMYTNRRAHGFLPVQCAKNKLLMQAHAATAAHLLTNKPEDGSCTGRQWLVTPGLRHGVKVHQCQRRAIQI